MIYSIITILLILFSCLSGCRASSGVESSASGSVSSCSDPEKGLIADTEQVIAAGLNLNENIYEEESITVYGEIERVEGLEGEALSLDSYGEFISLTDSEDLVGGGSVSVWVYPTENISFEGISS